MAQQKCKGCNKRRTEEQFYNQRICIECVEKNRKHALRVVNNALGLTFNGNRRK